MYAEILVLDAFGVIYEMPDDLKEGMLPFLKKQGGLDDSVKVKQLYIEASLGRITASEFWRAVGLSLEHEDDYLSCHRVIPGLHGFLDRASKKFSKIWCLSNDVSKWSKKLRQRHGLTSWINGFMISGDVGSRKPDKEIYKALTDKLNTDPKHILFVDDREVNLDTAALLGMKTMLFNPNRTIDDSKHLIARELDEIISISGK